METTLKVALGEQTHLQEFFAVMKENGRNAQAEDIEQLLKQMEEMKTGFTDALEEICYLREQIDSLQSQSMKAKLRKLQEDVQASLQQAQNRAISVKKAIVANIQSALDAGKQKGITALDKTLDIVPVYESLSVMESFLEHSASAMNNRIGKVDIMADEVYAVKSHARNIGKVISGKETQDLGERDRTKGILAKIEKSMEYCHKLIVSLAVKTIMAKAHIEHFRELSGRPVNEVPTVKEIAETMRAKGVRSTTVPFQANEAR